MPRSNEGMRIIFSAVVGVMLGYLFGISFPTVNITKVKKRIICLSRLLMLHALFIENLDLLHFVASLSFQYYILY